MYGIVSVEIEGSVRNMQGFPVKSDYDAEIHDGLAKLFEVSAYLGFPFTVEEAANYFLPKSNITGMQLSSLLSSETFSDLKFVVKDGYLFATEGQSVASRREREKMSAAKLESAASFAKLLSRLVPFVRTIAVTGSVAYGSADKWDDIDLFVLTERKRLWMSTLLMLIQIRLHKLLRIRPAHLLQFCMSYVHDEEGFSNESRRSRTNALFARELLKAKPVAGMEKYRRILEENQWVSEFYSISYRQKLRLLAGGLNGAAVQKDGTRGVHSLFSDWGEGIAYMFLSRYLRLRAYLANLKLKAEGKNLRSFEPVISSESCVYTSNFYRWLTTLWGDS